MRLARTRASVTAKVSEGAPHDLIRAALEVHEPRESRRHAGVSRQAVACQGPGPARALRSPGPRTSGAGCWGGGRREAGHHKLTGLRDVTLCPRRGIKQSSRVGGVRDGWAPPLCQVGLSAGGPTGRSGEWEGTKWIQEQQGAAGTGGLFKRLGKNRRSPGEKDGWGKCWRPWLQSHTDVARAVPTVEWGQPGRTWQWGAQRRPLGWRARGGVVAGLTPRMR